jgi:flagellar assembly protein FliH
MAGEDDAMETVIRAPRLALQRARLQSLEVGEPAGEPSAATTPVLVNAVDAARIELESRIRAELVCQLEQVAKAELDASRKRGFAQGLDEGRAQSELEAKAHEEQRRRETHTVLEGVRSALRKTIEDLTGQAAAISFEAVCRIAGERAASKEFVLGTVESIIAYAKVSSAFSLRMHPRDAATLRAALQAPDRVAGHAVEIVEDESIACGGCVIDAAIGSFDGKLETQLRRLRAVLSGVDGSEATGT